MRSATWLRRAQRLALFALTTLAWAAAPSISGAQDGPPPGDGPPPPHAERRAPSPYWLNMQVDGVPSALAAQLKLKEGEGVVVQRVGADGPAAKAGIQANDVILEIGDKPVKDPRDVSAAIKTAEGKEISIKLLREGKPMTVAVTPGKRTEDVIKRLKDGDFDVGDLGDLERQIRDRLKDLGGELRLQVIRPGRVMPPGVPGAEFPDDLTVNIHKEGKKPADVEVKKGDKTWTVKENDLSQLPDDVKPHVEGLLGRSPLPFRIHLGGPGGDGPDFPHPPRGPEARRRGPPPPDGPDGPEGPDGPRPPRRPEPPEGPGARRPPGTPDVPGVPDGPDAPRARRPGGGNLRGGRGDAPEARERDGDRERGAEDRLDRRLRDFDKRLEAMQEQIERLLKKE